MDEIRGKGDKAFVAYLMAGDPTLAATNEIVRALAGAGVTAVELGVPFSDPIADGPVIQAAANRALASGVTLPRILAAVRELRESCGLPILLMGYWNVFQRYGRDRVLEDARVAGVDGFVIPDLPPDAEPGFYERARAEGLATVCLASELTPDARLAQIALHSTGFLYYVPRMGITGLDLSVTQAIRERLERIRAHTDCPVCVGMGVKTREDVRLLHQAADGVIVGTRIVDCIDRSRDADDLPARVAALAKELCA
jgi:tryptophan synthase alpha chain